MKPKRFDRLLVLSSIPLRQVGTDFLPTGIASGCIVTYRGRRWLLTVAHATRDTGPWAIEIGYEEGRGTKLYSVGGIHFVSRGDCATGKISDLDLAYVSVPEDVEPRWQPSNDRGERIEDKPRIIIRTNLDSTPGPKAEYGFAGNTAPTDERHFGRRYQGAVIRLYTRLKYVGETEDYHLFRLPSSRPPELLLKGTSGAPILDRRRNLVALVCGADNTPDGIRGIKSGYFRSALDAELAGEDSGKGSTAYDV